MAPSVGANSQNRNLSDLLCAHYLVTHSAGRRATWRSAPPCLSQSPPSRRLLARPPHDGDYMVDKAESEYADIEIEITPQMMEAGFSVLARSGIAGDYLEADKLLLADIYRAMAAQRPHP